MAGVDRPGRQVAGAFRGDRGGVPVGAAAQVVATLRRTLERHRIDAELFFGQNDGTVMTLERALGFPVLMIGSGPASAMRGAAWLSGVTAGVVVDVGGARADVGILVNGFPREAPAPIRVAGVRTGCRTPDVISLPFGGGTVIARGTARPGSDLGDQALVFGGETATLIDAAVAAGRVVTGSRALTLRQRRTLAGALAPVDAQLADAVDRIKGAPHDEQNRASSGFWWPQRAQSTNVQVTGGVPSTSI